MALSNTATEGRAIVLVQIPPTLQEVYASLAINQFSAGHVRFFQRTAHLVRTIFSSIIGPVFPLAQARKQT